MNRRDLLKYTAAIGFAALTPTFSAPRAGLAATPRTLTLQAYPLTGESLGPSVLGEIQQVLVDRLKNLKSPNATVTVEADGLVTITITGDDLDDAAIAAVVRRNLVEVIDPRGEYLADGAEVTTSLSGPPWTPPDSATPEPASATPAGTYDTIVSSADIAEAFPVRNALGQIVVGFRLTPEGGDRLFAYSSANLGKPISIVVDNMVVSTATLNGAIRDRGIIEGLPEKEVHALVASLAAPPLPAHLVLIEPTASSGKCCVAMFSLVHQASLG